MYTDEVLHHNEIWSGLEKFKSIICTNSNVLAYVAGHSHALEYNPKIENCNVAQFITGGGGAELRPRLVKNSEFYQSDFGFLTISISTQTKEVSFIFYDDDLTPLKVVKI
jgi:hypothetical protein